MIEKSNTELFLQEIFKHPTTKYTIRGLAKKTRLSPPTALRVVQKLEKEGIIQKSRVGTASQVSANINSKTYIWMKRVNNLRGIYESGMIEEIIKEFNEPQAIILFGSYGRGEDIERSDIDIAIITSRENKMDMNKYEEILGRTISLHCITLDNVSKEFKSNLCNGIILNGAL